MDKMTEFFGGVVLAFGGMFLLICLGTLMGAVSGSVVGLFFGDTILGILGQIGVHSVSMWQFGAFMGFCGSFLKTKVTAEVKAAGV